MCNRQIACKSVDLWRLAALPQQTGKGVSRCGLHSHWLFICYTLSVVHAELLMAICLLAPGIWLACLSSLQHPSKALA